MNTKYNILVTGGTGFLGKRLVKRLLDLGHNVTAMGRNTSKAVELEKLGAKFLQVDLINKSEVINACKSIDYIFHCGAKSSPWGKYQEFYESNVVGTENIIAGCQQNQVKRLIHISTTSIYSEFRDKYNLKENAPLPNKSINYYSKTKLMAEDIIEQAQKDGLGTIVIRPSGIFGSGDTAILPRLIEANNKRFIPVLNNKTVKIDITHIDNVVDALVLCLDSPEHTLGKKYNITNDDPINLHVFLKDLIKRLGYEFRPMKLPFKLMYIMALGQEWLSKCIFNYREPALTRYSLCILTHSRVLDISAARYDLGYEPRVSITDGVEEVITNWRESYGEVSTI